MKIMPHRLRRTLLPFVMIWLSAPVTAQQDCAVTTLEIGPTFTTGPDCIISWVDHNRVQTLTWRAVEDDFQPATLDQTHDGTTLTSSHLPELIDVDQDGWRDLVTFTPAGMVNGIYEVFLFAPAGGFFVSGQSLFGHTLSRDRDGYLVVASRSGPGTVLRFFTIMDQAVRFAFEIDPYVTRSAQSGAAFSCDISVTSSGGAMQDQAGVTGALPENPDLQRYYCETEPAPSRQRRDADLAEDRATSDRVPTGTVFYCRLEDGTHKVTISRDARGLRYAYGPLAGDPELVLDRPTDAVAILPMNGTGPGRFGQIVFDNAAYAYTVYYSYDPVDDPSAATELRRGLIVTKDGDAARPVFAKDCLAGSAYDTIATLDPR